MVCLLSILALFSVPAASGADEDPLRLDLESLQGRWERVTGGQKPGREVLLIAKDREALTLEQKDGTVIRTLTARIELERMGDVVIYNRTEITGPVKGFGPRATTSRLPSLDFHPTNRAKSGWKPAWDSLGRCRSPLRTRTGKSNYSAGLGIANRTREFDSIHVQQPTAEGFS